ncbi:MAG: hypothetical protein H0X24_02320 [Ktedonobacterales bacterium]|nr:hypothetical protein [Ktedonobacterales bacterium]
MNGPAHIGDQSLAVALFEQYTIRRVWYKEEWYYSLVDCMIPLSTTKNKQRYWTDLNTRLREEMGDNYEDIVVMLKLPTKDSRLRKSACANTAGVLRVIQSVASPKAEPFKRWMAEVAAADLVDMERAEYRLKLHQFDVELHTVAQQRGVDTPEGHQRLNDANYMGLYNGLTEQGVIRLRRLPFSGTPPDFMGTEELADNLFQRAHTKARIETLNLQGQPAIDTAAITVGREVRETLARLGRPMPEELPQYRLISRGDWVPPEQLSRVDWDAEGEEPEEEATWQVIEIPAPKPAP